MSLRRKPGKPSKLTPEQMREVDRKRTPEQRESARRQFLCRHASTVSELGEPEAAASEALALFGAMVQHPHLALALARSVLSGFVPQAGGDGEKVAHAWAHRGEWLDAKARTALLSERARDRLNWDRERHRTWLVDSQRKKVEQLTTGRKKTAAGEKPRLDKRDERLRAAARKLRASGNAGSVSSMVQQIKRFPARRTADLGLRDGDLDVSPRTLRQILRGI